ncbi:hypothetical protein LP420_03950 [Massilia sp. B-10]|nr:hypothetical protein LP420_03950 [Massilia sp. B-10]
MLAIYATASAIIAPIYTACGFTLYLNRRASLEAWDLELQLRQITRPAASRAHPQRAWRGAAGGRAGGGHAGRGPRHARRHRQTHAASPTRAKARSPAPRPATPNRRARGAKSTPCMPVPPCTAGCAKKAGT